MKKILLFMFALAITGAVYSNQGDIPAKINTFVKACNEESKSRSEKMGEKRYITIMYKDNFYHMITGGEGIPPVRLTKGVDKTLKSVCPDALKNFK